jgi:hypothetical protein
MSKTYRVPHYLLVFKNGSPKTKGFENRDEMLCFLATTKRTVGEYRVNGTKQAQSILQSIQAIAKTRFGTRNA